jgi:hypothetical protein
MGDYSAAVQRLHDLGVMINGSFVFGMDGDDPSMFERTVSGPSAGHRTSTFTSHAVSGTALYKRMAAEGQLTETNWDLCDTRHTVFRPARMTGGSSKRLLAYRQFYVAQHHARRRRARQRLPGLRHSASSWKKFEPLWDW